MTKTLVSNITGPKGDKGDPGDIGEISDAEVSGLVAEDGTDTNGAVVALVAGQVPDQGTPIGAALSATIDDVVAAATADLSGGPIANTVVLFGTSLEAQNGLPRDTLDIASGASIPPLAGRGWFHWCNALAGNRLTLVYNAGVGGDTYAQMRARIDADVLAYDSDWVFMGAPMNDVAGGRTASAIIADAVFMLDKLAGRRVLIMTHPPHTGLDTTGERSVLAEVNDWIRNLPSIRSNVIVADAWRALSDGVNVDPATNTTTDGIHYSNVGAARVGAVAARAVAPWLSAQPYRVTSAIDPACIIANPSLASGTGWSVLGTGVSASYVADDDDGLTTKAVLTFTGVTSTGNLGVQYQENVSGGRWAAGDVIQASGRVRWENVVPLGVASNFGPFVLVTFRAVDNTTVEYSWGITPSLQLTVPSNAPTSGDSVVSTALYTIPATLTSGSAVNRIEVRFGFRGIESGTVTVSDVAPVKVV